MLGYTAFHTTYKKNGEGIVPKNPVSLFSWNALQASCRLGGAIAQPNINEQNLTILLGYTAFHTTYKKNGEGIV
ncbi:MAG: hypothetical protein SXA11_07915, partial [Cyanobacteriota bacterium]|nr:hypothetical protein [Cyanobacteriota bacterium]